MKNRVLIIGSAVLIFLSLASIGLCARGGHSGGHRGGGHSYHGGGHHYRGGGYYHGGGQYYRGGPVRVYYPGRYYGPSYYYAPYYYGYRDPYYPYVYDGPVPYAGPAPQAYLFLLPQPGRVLSHRPELPGRLDEGDSRHPPDREPGTPSILPALF